ncbi:hypothetical protein OXX80_002427 [Metschnikowia pulcherrima]|uniref:Uncharacterized protein n=1 Tax=Metschnikowia pulcherrima TaxID=27326 RepID=A0A8H7GP70_9ASCO|nr:hypothetical protein HF325_005795 [Metschnikowia pulcherrima]
MEDIENSDDSNPATKVEKSFPLDEEAFEAAFGDFKGDGWRTWRPSLVTDEPMDEIDGWARPWPLVTGDTDVLT